VYESGGHIPAKRRPPKRRPLKKKGVWGNMRTPVGGKAQTIPMAVLHASMQLTKKQSY